MFTWRWKGVVGAPKKSTVCVGCRGGYCLQWLVGGEHWLDCWYCPVPVQRALWQESNCLSLHTEKEQSLSWLCCGDSWLCRKPAMSGGRRWCTHMRQVLLGLSYLLAGLQRGCCVGGCRRRSFHPCSLWQGKVARWELRCWRCLCWMLAPRFFERHHTGCPAPGSWRPLLAWANCSTRGAKKLEMGTVTWAGAVRVSTISFLALFGPIL